MARLWATRAPDGLGASAQRRSLVGAIRWDAWHGDLGVPGRAVQKSLGPARYHFRLPWFAAVLGEDRVEIRGGRQEVMDQEIEYLAALQVAKTYAIDGDELTLHDADGDAIAI